MKVLFFSLAFLASLSLRAQVHIVFYEDVSPQLRKEIVADLAPRLQSVYHMSITGISVEPLPADAYFPARHRYRSELLLRHLQRDGFTLGITSKDISATTAKAKDWGIFGQGRNPGNTTVVSSFRLKGVASRVSKVAIHEIGHNYGLPHCPQNHCIMEDGNASIKGIDAENDLCAACKLLLKRKL